MEICNGDGMCLIRKQHTCGHNCILIRCPNYFLCSTAEPQCVLWCHHNNPHGKLYARTRVMTGSNGNNAEDWTIRCDYLTTLEVC